MLIANCVSLALLAKKVVIMWPVENKYWIHH